jgi:hypothetical protein
VPGRGAPRHSGAGRRRRETGGDADANGELIRLTELEFTLRNGILRGFVRQNYAQIRGAEYDPHLRRWVRQPIES